MTALNKVIFGGYRALQIEDEADRRALNLRVTGEPHLSNMDDGQKQAVVSELRRLGYRKTAPKASGREGKLPLDGKYLAKMRALWIALYNLGLVEDRRDSAMEEFALGRQLPHLDGLRFVHTPKDGQSVVDALKKWAERAGVDWSNAGLPMRSPVRALGCKVAVAQWAILMPRGAHLFWSHVNDILDQDELYRGHTDAEWITVMNYLGKRIRAEKPAGAK